MPSPQVDGSMARALPPLVARAASGRLPGWNQVSPLRREHMKRVAALMEAWARALELPDRDVERWRAAAFLHDVLRDADWDQLRQEAGPLFLHLPGPLLHGPVAAQRLEAEGVTDGDLLRAVAYHTVGHPELDLLGQALFVADFVEPGREEGREWRRELREAMPGDWDRVVRTVAAARIRRTVERGWILREETVGFWNHLVQAESQADPGVGSHPESRF